MSSISSSDKLKFLIVVLISGTGMFVIPHHITYVGKEFAIAYRMLLGGLLVAGFSVYKKRPFPKISMAFFGPALVSGLLLYSLNYLFIYQALLGLPSGICSLIIAAIIVPNLLLGRLILKNPLRLQTIIGALLSLLGLGILFPGDLLDFDLKEHQTVSFLFMFSSLFISSFGTVMTSKFMKKELDFYWLTATAMIIGGIFNLGYGYYINGSLSWSFEPMHFVVWFYMAIAATAVVFIFYMQIVNKFGAGNASYIWILAPTIALNLSYFFEDMDWDTERTWGTIIILLGGAIALFKRKRVIAPQPSSP